MRTLLGGALLAALVVVLSSVPAASAPAAAPPASHPPLPLGLAARSQPHSGPGPAVLEPALPRPVDATLRTANVSIPWAGSPPTSAIFANPPPTLPDTTPVVETVASNTTNCCSYLNFAAPAGPFALIELNYTGTVYGSVYDSSYRAYVDGVPILFGTTPEFGRWIVLKDLTEYASLFQGEVNVTFLLSAALLPGGSFTSTVTVALYPVPSGAAPPSYATEVIPLWTPAYVKSGVPTLTTNVTVPSNATNATLELYAYGFSADEFWYASEPTEAAFRAVQVSADGSPVATVLPFPYLNTGGLDLFLWRPIPADFTLDDRPYHVDLTGALGQLEGTHAISVTVVGRDAASPWIVMGSLFVTTSATAPPAVTTADTVLPLVDHTTMPTGSSYDNLGTVSYSFASTFSSGGVTTNISSSVVERFVNDATITGSGWENLTGLSTMTFYTNVSTPTTSRSSWSTYDFAFGVDLGGSFVETSNTGGGYPIYGNFTSYTLNVVQEWNETGLTAAGTGYSVDERLGASGVYAGREERINANAAQILSINFIQSQTTEEFVYRLVNGSLTELIDHLLVGSSYQPPGPNNVETVTVDRWDTPLAATLAPSVSVADLGERFTFSGLTVGGRGGVSVAWLPGIPTGCSVTASPLVLSCRPTATGTLTATLEASDGAGDAPAVAQSSVIVLADPTATIASDPPVADLGMSFTVTPTIGGGVAPYRCAWTLTGGTPGRAGSCATALTIPANATGLLGFTLTVSDATGGSWSYAFNLTVNALPTVTVQTSTSSTTVGSGVEVSANLSGGTAPYTVNWSVSVNGGASRPAGTGAVVVFTPSAPGVYVFTASVVDALGQSTASASTNLTVAAVGSSSAGSAGTSLPTWQLLGLVAALAVEAIALVALLVLRQQGRRRRPPPRKPRPTPEATSAPPDWEE
ncbi:MAG: hypothetical protein L3K23_04570 [Thermoplasmata archaeon]|nr:hypothetical protein [Thermoplasmata archaeon]